MWWKSTLPRSPGSPRPSQTGPDGDGYCPEPAPAWWKLAADDRQEPIARLRAWVEQVYRPGYGHLAAGLGPCWPAHDLCLYGARHRLRTVVGAVPAARPQPRAAVRPGRIPGPHPARPGRPAPGRDQHLRPPPQPRAGRRPALEHAMTDATLRQALAFAARGWPVLPCQPGQKTPATRHGVRDATTDPGQITAWFGRHPDWNLAIATGAPGPDVLDVDQHGEAGNGYAAFSQLRGGRAAGRGPRLRAHPQRRAARLLHRHRPAQRPPARSSPGLPLPRRLRPRPALPGRRQALPADPDTPRPTARWTGTPSSATCNPSASPRPGTPSPAARTSAGLARWVASQAEGNRNAGLFWAANRALEADPAADLSPLAAAARQAGLDEQGDHPNPRLRPQNRPSPHARTRPPGRGR